MVSNKGRGIVFSMGWSCVDTAVPKKGEKYREETTIPNQCVCVYSGLLCAVELDALLPMLSFLAHNRTFRRGEMEYRLAFASGAAPLGPCHSSEESDVENGDENALGSYPARICWFGRRCP